MEGSEPYVTHEGNSDGDHIGVTTNHIYTFLTTRSGIDVKWDGGTSLYITLSPAWESRVCGLCGNFDGNTENDLISHSGVLEENPIVFGQ